jgi:hypothetical protein
LWIDVVIAVVIGTPLYMVGLRLVEFGSEAPPEIMAPLGTLAWFAGVFFAAFITLFHIYIPACGYVQGLVPDWMR